MIGAIASTTCTQCRGGTYSAAFGASDIAACTGCGVGTYSATQGLSTSGGCSGCALGSYTNLVGTGSTGCVPCDPGFYQPFANAKSIASCYPCPRYSKATLWLSHALSHPTWAHATPPYISPP